MSTWSFEAAVTAPDGVRVNVTITVPARVAWENHRECGELAEMTVRHGLKLVGQSQERNPEVPF